MRVRVAWGQAARGPTGARRGAPRHTPRHATPRRAAPTPWRPPPPLAQGIIVNGCIRDSETIGTFSNLGVKALATHPLVRLPASVPAPAARRARAASRGAPHAAAAPPMRSSHAPTRAVPRLLMHSPRRSRASATPGCATCP
jgi:hypothetical protein